jgi:hypothetical protein
LEGRVSSREKTSALKSDRKSVGFDGLYSRLAGWALRNRNVPPGKIVPEVSFPKQLLTPFANTHAKCVENALDAGPDKLVLDL